MTYKEAKQRLIELANGIQLNRETPQGEAFMMALLLVDKEAEKEAEEDQA